MIELSDPKSCSGCNACTSICPAQCITMESDIEGFWYPRVDNNNCINCNMCKNICPILHISKTKYKAVAYGAYNKNDTIRMSSSSGGMFTLFTQQVINRGGIVFGAAFNDHFDVVHCYAKTLNELGKLRGSKYAQSRMGNSFIQVEEFLKKGDLVYFSGTPCQVGGLKAYLQQEYENLICQDIVCHGVPSPKVWSSYIEYQKCSFKSTIKAINFRYKEPGWIKFSLSICFFNGAHYVRNHNNDLYMKAFLKNICLRPSCYDCSFKGISRQADITLADFWGVQEILPEIFDDKGTSLAIIHSSKGMHLFNAVNNDMVSKEVNLEKALQYNPAALQSPSPNPNRNSFFKELDHKPINVIINKYCNDSIVVRVIEAIHRISNKFKRNPTADLACKALRRALQRRRPRKGL